jgi:hypothetical protein
VESCGGLDSCGSGQELVAGFCEHGNEPSSSIKGGEFIDWLTYYYAPWSYSVSWFVSY